jgi:transcriptional regulator with XRE-family HTH domain
MSSGRPPKSKRSAFGEKLLAARLTRCLTQAEVAARVGVSQQAYAGWERRTDAIKPEYIAKVARVLSLRLEELLSAQTEEIGLQPAASRVAEIVLRLNRLPEREQDRILGILEDLVAGAVRRRRKARPARRRD